MRLIKMLGLAAVAALAATAFIGASSASAVVLCEESTKELGECNAGATFVNGTIFHGELVTGTHSQFLTNLGTDLCKKSTVLGEVLSSTEASLDGDITSLTFGECKRGEEECEVNAENLPYLVLLLLTALGAGEPDYHAVVQKWLGAGGAPQVLLKCGSLIHCKYSANEVLFKVLPKATDVVLSVLQELERLSGFPCSEKSTWHAEYLLKCLKPAGTLKSCWPALKP